MTYEKAMAELIELDNTDVITTSGETGGSVPTTPIEPCPTTGDVDCPWWMIF